MTSAWPATEAAINRWVRESTGFSGTSCYWPAKGRIEPNPPCVEMKVTGGRQTGRAGVIGSKKTAQPTEWLATLTAAVGTFGVQIWTDSSATPDVDVEIVIEEPDEDDPTPTIAEARNALLAALTPELPAGITATASGTTAISIVGATADDVFSMGASETITLTLVASPYSSTRHTRVVKVLMLDFRAVPTAGEGTATEYANAVRNAIGDYRHLIRRTGWNVGANIGDRPGYEDDATESRHVLEFELLGHEVDYAIPRPWVRRGPAATATASDLTTSFAPQ
jgi:hypothetical protein